LLQFQKLSSGKTNDIFECINENGTKSEIFHILLILIFLFLQYYKLSRGKTNSMFNMYTTYIIENDTRRG